MPSGEEVEGVNTLFLAAQQPTLQAGIMPEMLKGYLIMPQVLKEYDLPTLVGHLVDFSNRNRTSVFTEDFYRGNSFGREAQTLFVRFHQHEELLSEKLRIASNFMEWRYYLNWEPIVRWKYLLQTLNGIRFLPKNEQAPIVFKMFNIMKNTVRASQNPGALPPSAALITLWYNTCADLLPRILGLSSTVNQTISLDSILCDLRALLGKTEPEFRHRAKYINEMRRGINDPYGNVHVLSNKGCTLIYLVEPNYLLPNGAYINYKFSDLALNHIVSTYFSWSNEMKESGMADLFAPHLGPKIGLLLVFLSKDMRVYGSVDRPESFGVIGRSKTSWSHIDYVQRQDLLLSDSPLFFHDPRECQDILRRLKNIGFPFEASGVMDGITRGLMTLDTSIDNWVYLSRFSRNLATKTLSEMMRNQKKYQYAIPQYDDNGAVQYENGLPIINPYSKSTLLVQLADFGLHFSFSHFCWLTAHEMERNHKITHFFIPLSEMAAKTNAICRGFYKLRISRELSYYDSDGTYTNPFKKNSNSTDVKGLHSSVQAIRSYLFLLECNSCNYPRNENSVTLSQGTIDITHCIHLPYLIQEHLGHLFGGLFNRDVDFVSELLSIFSSFIEKRYKEGKILTMDKVSESVIESDALRAIRKLNMDSKLAIALNSTKQPVDTQVDELSSAKTFTPANNLAMALNTTRRSVQKGDESCARKVNSTCRIL